MSSPIRFLSPSDWQEVGNRHSIRFVWPGDTSPPSVELFDRDAFVQWMQQPAGRPPAPRATIPARRADADGLCVASSDGSLLPGLFILGVRQPGSSSFAAVVGVRVARSSKSWDEFLPQLLAVRCGRVAATRPDHPVAIGPAAEPLFSVTTTVYDTPPEFVEELCECLRQQLHGDFEWLLLDNGSRRRDTVECLRAIAAREPRVRFFRVEDNIHIIPGNRYLLERARGRYVVPVDSDDIVYPDALELLRRHIQVENPPDLLYSEECKVAQDGVPTEYIWRPGFSLLFALATCPAAHLMAFDRERALAAEAYSDTYAQGSHDWDSCLRMLGHGARAQRVPHVLYGWRMHEGSSAMNERSKDYLRSSQIGVLEHALRRMGCADRFEVDGIDEAKFGFFHLRRLPVAPRPLAVDFIVRRFDAEIAADLTGSLATLDYPMVQLRVLVDRAIGGAELARVQDVLATAGRQHAEIVSVALDEFGAQASFVPEGALAKVVIDASLRLERRDWLWDVLGTFELDPSVGVVGGRILDEEGLVQHIGYFAGLDGFVATPRHGQPVGNVIARLADLRRGVSAVHGGLMAVREGVFGSIGPMLDVDSADGVFGTEFCFRASGHGFGVAYTPRFAACTRRPLAKSVGRGHPLRTLLKSTEPRISATDPFYTGLLEQCSSEFGARIWSVEESEPGEEQARPQGPQLLPGIPAQSGSRAPVGLARGVSALSWWVRSVARQATFRAIRFVHRRPFRTRLGYQVPAPTEEKSPPSDLALARFLPPTGLLSPADPLHFVVDPKLAACPTLNVLLPGIAMESMSGGPNTVFNLCYRMAAAGVPVRFLSTGVPLASDLSPVWQHVQRLAGIEERLPGVSFVDASDRCTPVAIGPEDVFLATAWWTAQMVKYALPLVRPKRFLYVIQDFEPVLHEHSTSHALALETYGMDYVPIVNHALLADYLSVNRVGRFADRDFAAQCTVIDPAIDRTRFHPELEGRRSPRRLLFYSRPRSAKRNLYELGVAALKLAVQNGSFDAEPWELLAMGDPVAPVDLGRGKVLRPAPWRDFDGYAAQMRDADVLLSLMLSPHPSYPPLEMAACGGLVVTNSYANKTARRFAEISTNIDAPEPTIEAVGEALANATRRVSDSRARLAGANLASPASWADALAPVLPRAVAAFHACREGAR